MKKLLSLTLLGALLLGACSTGGEDLQGRFGTSTTKWTMELSDSSPSGARTVSASDDILAFDITLPTKNTLAVGSQFTVSFATDGDIDPLADGTTVTLKANGKTVGTGTFSLVDPSIPNEGTALITTTTSVALKGGKATTFTVNTDTASILAEEAGMDDPLTMSVEYNGKTVAGITMVY